MNPAHVPVSRSAPWPASPTARAFVALLAAAIALLAACSSDPSSTPTRPPASRGVLATPSGPPATFGPPPSPTPPDDTSPITLDPALLAFLPESVGGIKVIEDIDEAANALNDPGLPRIAAAVDGAVAVDTGTGNLVYGWVVKLRHGGFTDADYRQWRDAYDDGACASTGGVVGRAEATISGRQTYVTSCAAGLNTYHVWLQTQDILISASSIGDARFGEQLLEGLRLPS